MILSKKSHAEIEAFLREHFKDPDLCLPPISIHSGVFAGLLTKWLRIGAITFGRHVFISPRKVAQGEGGRRAAPGWLIAHEATHVIQYDTEGFVKFFAQYLRDYFRALRETGNWDAAARMAAYLAIAHECEAREVEHAFAPWCEAKKTAREGAAE